MKRDKLKREQIKQKRAQYTSLATARFVRMTPRKGRLVADLIRGKNVMEARDILKFASRPSAAPHILKLLNSAAKNAEMKQHGESDELIVALITVDEGPTMKRIQPGAMGRAFQILKRTSHVTIGLKDKI